MFITSSTPTAGATGGGATALPERPIAQRYGTSEELRPLPPRGYGYPIPRRDRWRASMMMNTSRAPTTRCSSTASPSTRTRRSHRSADWSTCSPCRGAVTPTDPGGGAPGSTIRSRKWTLPGRRPDRRDRRPPARWRAGLTVSRPLQHADLHRAAHVRHGRRPAVRGHAAAARARPEAHLVVAVGDRLGRARGEPACAVCNAAYDGERPHMRVMGIARPSLRAREGGRGRVRATPRTCRPSTRGSPGARPPLDLTLARRSHEGNSRPVDRPAGTAGTTQWGHARARQPLRVCSKPNLFDPARRVPVIWRFGGAARRDATLRQARSASAARRVAARHR